MAYKVYKLERKTSNRYWYEVMLSPFLRVRAAGDHISKYEQYYPQEEAMYRVLDAEVDGVVYRRLKRFFNRLSKRKQ